jgi:hypothetical protein
MAWRRRTLSIACPAIDRARVTHPASTPHLDRGIVRLGG